MADQKSEIRYLTAPSIDTKKKKYCRFKKSGDRKSTRLNSSH